MHREMASKRAREREWAMCYISSPPSDQIWIKKGRESGEGKRDPALGHIEGRGENTGNMFASPTSSVPFLGPIETV